MGMCILTNMADGDTLGISLTWRTVIIGLRIDESYRSRLNLGFLLCLSSYASTHSHPACIFLTLRTISKVSEAATFPKFLGDWNLTLGILSWATMTPFVDLVIVSDKIWGTLIYDTCLPSEPDCSFLQQSACHQSKAGRVESSRSL